MKQWLVCIALAFISLQVKAQQIGTYNVHDLMTRVSNDDTLYIVNFWATWCGPCVRELPEFYDLSEAYKGRPVKVLLVSLDFKEAYPRRIESFIRKKRLPHEVIWLNETNANEFIPKIDNRWQGSIPATLIINKRTEYKNFFEGMISAKQLQPLIDKQLALH